MNRYLNVTLHGLIDDLMKKFEVYVGLVGATAVSPPPPLFMIDYDREFHADSEKYKNIALKINGKCSNSTSKF